MLRLNYCSRNIFADHKTGTLSKTMYAIFDQVTKSGKLKRKQAEQFIIKNDVFVLNGQKYQLSEHIDIFAEAEEVMAYLKKIASSDQIDMFLEPPSSRDILVRHIYADLKWDYPDLNWRAMDESGAIPYFTNRPKLDNAGFWVSPVEGELPRYSKYLCVAEDDFRFSVQSNQTLH